MSHISSSIFTRIRHAGKLPKRVWLTLDDGPDPTNTDTILKVLDRHRIKAAFFMIGEKVAAQPTVAQRVFDAGHRIGNHSFSHRRLTQLTAAEIHDEIEITSKLISAFTRDERIFRPPFGAIDQTVCAIADNLGHRTVLWNVDPTDWDLQCQPKGWIDKALHAAQERDTCVILAHDNQRTTAENFDLFISRLKESGRIVFEDPATLCTIAGQLHPD